MEDGSILELVSADLDHTSSSLTMFLGIIMLLEEPVVPVWAQLAVVSCLHTS